MLLLKGKTWGLSFHTYRYWKDVMQNPNEEHPVPFFSKGIKWDAYGDYRLNEEDVIANGIYCFPFAFRHFTPKEKEGNEK